eukprot:s2342_g10.t1
MSDDEAIELFTKWYCAGRRHAVEEVDHESRAGQIDDSRRASGRVMSKSSRNFQKQLQQMQIDWFLERHNFHDVNEPQRGFQLFSEKLYPIHVAVLQGDSDMLDILPQS